MPITNPGATDADLTLIPDQAEVWLAVKSDVSDIADMIPDAPDDDLAALGWEHTGLISDENGISLDASIDVREYDAFGHPKFRVKLKKGKLTSTFTAFEQNATMRKVVLPGSAANKIGAPRDVQIYVLYRFLDEDTATGSRVWVTLTAAPIEVKISKGIVEGDLWSAECTVHHTTDSNGDIFQVVDETADDVAKTFTIPGGVTAYTVSAGGSGPSTSIVPKTAAALQSALRALPAVQALPAPGATVTGPDGGPLVVTFTGPITPVTATGTGGTVVVS